MTVNTEIERNIGLLRSKHGSIELGALVQLYKRVFGKAPDHKLAGFKKFKFLLQTFPSIEFEYKDGNDSSVHAKLRAGDQGKGVVLEEEEHVAVTYNDVTQKLGNCQEHNQSPIGNVEELNAYFLSSTEDNRSAVEDKRTALVNGIAAKQLEEVALIGQLAVDSVGGDAVYLNTHQPFCFVTVGVQGAGKSHSLSCVLENCLLPLEIEGVMQLNKPMTCLVLHYDQNTTSVCEATGLLSPSRHLEAFFKSLDTDGSVPTSKAIVLVSPTFYKQRKAFYGEYCTVRPLLLKWKALTADHIKRIMRIEEGDTQLYVASFLNLLRGYQRRGVMPRFSNFMEEVKELCSVGSQVGPLQQRIALLESIIADSDVNESIRADSFDLEKVCHDGYSLIVADMTDPLLSTGEANSLFQVLTEQFRSLPLDNGKLLALDEAHKFMDGIKSDGLSEAIVNIARLMRHDGMRLAVSTQSPKALAPELLELVTVAFLHRFHSHDWWTYLQSKLPLANDDFEKILNLSPGDA